MAKNCDETGRNGNKTEHIKIQSSVKLKPLLDLLNFV